MSAVISPYNNKKITLNIHSNAEVLKELPSAKSKRMQIVVNELQGQRCTHWCFKGTLRMGRQQVSSEQSYSLYALHRFKLFLVNFQVINHVNHFKFFAKFSDNYKH